MKIFINKIKLCGIKNIQKEIELNFYNKTIGKEIILENNGIKAIYGANGAGKSAIIQAIDIYKKIISNTGFLYNEENVFFLDELINKKNREYRIEISFIHYEADTNLIIKKYKHFLEIKRDDNSYYIANEKYSELLTKSENILIHSSNGELLESTIDNSITKKMANMLRKRSVVDIYYELSRRSVTGNYSFDTDLHTLLILRSLISVKTENTDKHSLYINNVFRKNTLEKPSPSNPNTLSSEYSMIVDKKDIEFAKKYFNTLKKFIKIFKTDLKEISFEKKIMKNLYVLEPYFVYNGYKIHLEFESAGIKKLTKLYNYFRFLEIGGIVFIDELDANINDVYLMKILEYFNENEKGQLIFTTHNITPMQVLAKNSYGIDFITENGEITSWKKNGNYSPTSIYQSGLIEGLPFNVYPFDFVGVFGYDED